MSDGRPFWERDPKENEKSFLDRVMGSKAFDIISRAKEVRKEQEARGPLAQVEPGDKIPLELLNAAIGYSPEFAALLRSARRASTPEAERQRRRAKNKRARASRRRNQQIAAQARRRRQKINNRRAA
jgi:hypothetical protein